MSALVVLVLSLCVGFFSFCFLPWYASGWIVRVFYRTLEKNFKFYFLYEHICTVILLIQQCFITSEVLGFLGIIPWGMVGRNRWEVLANMRNCEVLKVKTAIQVAPWTIAICKKWTREYNSVRFFYLSIIKTELSWIYMQGNKFFSMTSLHGLCRKWASNVYSKVRWKILLEKNSQPKLEFTLP